MADLKIPNLNKNSENFFLKKKLSLRRKSRRKLKQESFLMLLFSFFWIYLVYVIPNKKSIFDNFFDNLQKLSENIISSIPYLFEICLGIFVVVSLIIAFLLLMGVISRVMKITKRKSKEITFR